MALVTLWLSGFLVFWLFRQKTTPKKLNSLAKRRIFYLLREDYKR